MRPLNQINQESSEEVNITPMLDVVFIMLIFFVVTASFVKEWGIGITGQSSYKGLVRANNNIVVRIKGSGTVSINDSDVDIRRVAPMLLKLRAKSPEAKVVLAPADDAQNGAVVAVLNASRSVGIQDVSFTEI